MAVLESMEGGDAGDQDWLLQMRILIRNAIYNICYIRGLFPEEYFRDNYVSESEMPVKRLIPKDVESRRLIDWVEQGVDDALQKKYLETAIFFICDKNGGTAVDEYSFTFRYPGPDEAIMELSLAGSQVDGTTFKSNPSDSIDLQIRSMIRACVAIMSSLEPLPEERTIQMKLMYYDDVTPEEYEPPLFECCIDGDDEEELAQMFGRLCCVSQRGPTLLFDSGTTHHICHDKSCMTEMENIRKKKQIVLETADGIKFKAKEAGSINFKNIHLNQMRYIPEVKFNLISIGYLDKQGLLITIANNEIYVIDVNKSIHVGEGYHHMNNNDYVVKAMNWTVPTEVELQLDEELEEDYSESWVIDTCCASHMAGRLDMLSNPRHDDEEYHTPRGTMKASHIGSVRNRGVKLSEVRYCPANANNLISAGILDFQGHRITFHKGVCTIVCKESYTEVGRAKLDNSNLLYYLKKIEITNAVGKRKRRNSSRRKKH